MSNFNILDKISRTLDWIDRMYEDELSIPKWKCIERLKEWQKELLNDHAEWEVITNPADLTPGCAQGVECPKCHSPASRHYEGVEFDHWSFCPVCGCLMDYEKTITKEMNK